jgi:hypothetical protein
VKEMFNRKAEINMFVVLLTIIIVFCFSVLGILIIHNLNIPCQDYIGYFKTEDAACQNLLGNPNAHAVTGAVNYCELNGDAIQVVMSTNSSELHCESQFKALRIK